MTKYLKKEIFIGAIRIIYMLYYANSVIDD